MKTDPGPTGSLRRQPCLPPRACSRNKFIPLFLLLAACCWPIDLSAQSDDFNDGNDNGWTRYDPLGDLGAGPQATFSFPNGAYRIQATKNPLFPSAVGVARAGSLREDVTYTNFYV